MRMAQERKLASQAAKATRRLEKEVLSCGLSRTLMERSVPTRPKSETEVKTTPST